MSGRPWIYVPPDPPCTPFEGGAEWVDILRWLVAVMDRSDPSLRFVAGCLRFALDQGGLTDKQARAASKVFERIFERWAADELACQAPVDHPLRDIEPKGSA